MASRLIVLRSKNSPDSWLNSEHREKIGRNAVALDVGGFTPFSESERIVGVNGEMGQNLVLRTPVREIGIRRGIERAGRSQPCVCLIEGDQFVRVRKRERP